MFPLLLIWLFFVFFLTFRYIHLSSILLIQLQALLLYIVYVDLGSWPSLLFSSNEMRGRKYFQT